MIVWLGPFSRLITGNYAIHTYEIGFANLVESSTFTISFRWQTIGPSQDSWEGPIKQSSRLRTIFSALAPVFSNLPAVWKSFQAPLRKSERRRSSVSVKAICDGQIFRVWKGKSEKGVFTYANLTGWDWDSLPQWSHVKFLVHVLYIGGWSEVNNVIYAGNRIMW